MLWIIITLALAAIIRQDWRHREVHLFPILLLSILAYSIAEPSWQSVLLNISFLGVQLVFLIIYFSLKRGHLIRLTQDYLGWGDILLFIIISFFFHPVNFILFIIGALSISILFHLILFHKYKNHDTVPLISYLGIVLAITLLADQVFFFQLDRFPILNL